MAIVEYCQYIRYINKYMCIHACKYAHVIPNIQVYSLDIMLTSVNKMCADKYSNQGWSIQMRTVRINNVLLFFVKSWRQWVVITAKMSVGVSLTSVGRYIRKRLSVYSVLVISTWSCPEFLVSCLCRSPWILIWKLYKYDGSSLCKHSLFNLRVFSFNSSSNASIRKDSKVVMCVCYICCMLLCEWFVSAF